MVMRWLSRVRVPRGSHVSRRCQIGSGTRINGPIIVKGRGACTIGRYCALGDGIRIITSTHKMNTANLQLRLQKAIGGDHDPVEQGPVARVNMPHRVPYGFHATWARGEDLYR